jgi:hypothetical protein
MRLKDRQADTPKEHRMTKLTEANSTASLAALLAGHNGADSRAAQVAANACANVEGAIQDGFAAIVRAIMKELPGTQRNERLAERAARSLLRTAMNDELDRQQDVGEQIRADYAEDMNG